MIPQEAFSPANTKKANNVIKGEFARPGQTDWAVLCSVKGISTILVFWNGSENNPAVLAAWKDTNYLQGDGGGQWAYSRRIEPMGMARSEEHTSELQSLAYLVCRLLLEKKKNTKS